MRAGASQRSAVAIRTVAFSSVILPAQSHRTIRTILGTLLGATWLADMLLFVQQRTGRNPPQGVTSNLRLAHGIFYSTCCSCPLHSP